MNKLIEDIINGLRFAVECAVVAGDSSAKYQHITPCGALIECFVNCNGFPTEVYIYKAGYCECDNVAAAVRDAIPGWDELKGDTVFKHYPDIYEAHGFTDIDDYNRHIHC